MIWFKKCKTSEPSNFARSFFASDFARNAAPIKLYRVYENGNETEFVFGRKDDAVRKVNELARFQKGFGDAASTGRCIEYDADSVKLVNFFYNETEFVWEIRAEWKEGEMK